MKAGCAVLVLHIVVPLEARDNGCLQRCREELHTLAIVYGSIVHRSAKHTAHTTVHNTLIHVRK